MMIGNPAPTFDLPGVDGRRHALDDYDGATALVIVQSCNHCPYVQAWEGRIDAAQRDYGSRGVRIVAVSSNDAAAFPEDSFEEMQARAQRQGFSFDYLYDKDGRLARALGSQRTPEVFVFGSERTLVYHGAVDDSRDERAVQRHYLREALDAILAGAEPPVAETAPVGCTVKLVAPRA